MLIQALPRKAGLEGARYNILGIFHADKKRISDRFRSVPAMKEMEACS
jgi:hypothetical protein